MNPPVVLTIAGFDPCSGAGATLDLRVFADFDCYGIATLTAITVQNSSAVFSAQLVDSSLITQSLLRLSEDFEIVGIKTGMLGDERTVSAVVEVLEQLRPKVLVVDPVLISTSGYRLLTVEGERLLLQRLLPLARLVTPNLLELRSLTGQAVEGFTTMLTAAQTLLRSGVEAVLVKGGHLPGSRVEELLVTRAEVRRFSHERLGVGEVHGTGCMLSAACTARLALGDSLIESVKTALSYTQRRIAGSLRLGRGSRLIWKE